MHELGHADSLFLVQPVVDEPECEKGEGHLDDPPQQFEDKFDNHQR